MEGRDVASSASLAATSGSSIPSPPPPPVAAPPAARVADRSMVVSHPAAPRAPRDVAPRGASPANAASIDLATAKFPQYRTKIRRQRNWLSQAIHWTVEDQPAWVTSFLAHALILLILGLIVVQLPTRPKAITLRFGAESQALDLTEFTLDLPSPSADQDTPELEAESIAVPTVEEIEATLVPAVALPTALNQSKRPSEAAFAAGWVGGLEGRHGRRGAATNLGATPDSESAVDRALVWLAAHQRRDGSWNFSLKGCNCGGCSHAGKGHVILNGATALALLPFLGAGQTHEKGYHRAAIEAGLQYLIRKQSNDGGFYESQGRMVLARNCRVGFVRGASHDRNGPGFQSRSVPQTKEAASRCATCDRLHCRSSAFGGRLALSAQTARRHVRGWLAGDGATER